KVDCLFCFVRKRVQNGPRNSAESRMKRNSSAEPCQLWADDICAHSVAEEIAFLFEMRDETIGSAFVDASLLRNFAKLEPVWRSIQRFKNSEDFSYDADWSRFGFTRANHGPISSLEVFAVFGVRRRLGQGRITKKSVPHAETPQFTIQNINFQY